MQETNVEEFIANIVPVFHYDKFKIKKLKKYDKQPLTSELMTELQECLMSAVTFDNDVK